MQNSTIVKLAKRRIRTDSHKFQKKDCLEISKTKIVKSSCIFPQLVSTAWD